LIVATALGRRAVGVDISSEAVQAAGAWSGFLVASMGEGRVS
jgi:hypothetical protein